MKKYLLALNLLCITTIGFSQTELTTNGNFESSPLGTGWTTTTANGNLWVGNANCSGANGSANYVWAADQNELTGVNNIDEDLRQQIQIPSNASQVTVFFKASINTAETGTTAYDEMTLTLEDVTGNVLHTLGSLSNLDADPSLTNCQTYSSYYVNIPSSFFGQSPYLSLSFETDGSLPTIFRVDDVSVLSYVAGCTYTLSQSSYSVPISGGTFNNAISINTQSNCSWVAAVTTGTNWLSTNSTGVGSGLLSFNATANTTGNSRTGIINIGGVDFTVTQQACSYSVSTNTVTVSGLEQINLDVLDVTTSNGCNWDATVINGNSWLTTSSSGNSSGSVMVNVSANTTNYDRYGELYVAGTYVQVIQEPLECVYTFSAEIFDCPDHTANSYTNISTVSSLNGCEWNAQVIDGANWLVCNSSGNGNGEINIAVGENSSPTSRTGSIQVGDVTMIISQPGNDPTGLESIDQHKISLYPNPTTDNISIHMTSSIAFDYVILDQTGRIVKSGNQHHPSTPIDVSLLSKGVYFVKIQHDNDSYIKEFIKQ